MLCLFHPFITIIIRRKKITINKKKIEKMKKVFDISLPAVYTFLILIHTRQIWHGSLL